MIYSWLVTGPDVVDTRMSMETREEVAELHTTKPRVFALRKNCGDAMLLPSHARNGNPSPVRRNAATARIAVRASQHLREEPIPTTRGYRCHDANAQREQKIAKCYKSKDLGA